MNLPTCQRCNNSLSSFFIVSLCLLVGVVCQCAAFQPLSAPSCKHFRSITGPLHAHTNKKNAKPPKAANAPLQDIKQSNAASSSSPRNGNQVPKKSELSRPERKALERAKKQENSVQSKYSNNKKSTVQQPPPTLTLQTSPDEVLRAIKRAQNQHNDQAIDAIAQFLLKDSNESYAYGYKGSLLARLAVAALHLRRDDVASEILHTRRLTFRSSMLPMESAAIVRGLLRMQNLTGAWDILEDELALPSADASWTDSLCQEQIKYRALALASIASRHFYNGEVCQSIRACERLTELGPVIQKAKLTAEYLEMPWERLLRGASMCQAGLRNGTFVPEDSTMVLPCNLVYTVLRAIAAFPSDNSDVVYELLSNALVRRVLFVTGAINMQGCPPSDRGEAVFIGRSNVGKSSLVNMVTNRKALAYTSKRPGKTQQFNFFAINDKPDREKEIKYGDVIAGEKDDDSFYIVDVPGFGYAKVPEHVRRDWLSFLDEYITTRKTLRVVFHLIDARLGPTREDNSIMTEMGNKLPPYVKYVIVLTKADKNVKSSQSSQLGKVSSVVMNRVHKAMESNGVDNAAVILTSAETKLGRDDVWQYLRLAAESRQV
jgi:GTP-binding protein